MIIRNFILTVSVIGMFFISGCGYHVGSIMHPQIKSIAIAPIKNETIEPLAAAQMRQALSEQFQLDSSVKVKDMETADCILYGRIVEVETTSTSDISTDNDFTFRAAEWGVTVEMEYTVVIPGRQKPLVDTRSITGSASYQHLSDHETTRRRGIYQACREAAEKVVEDITEGW